MFALVMMTSLYYGMTNAVIPGYATREACDASGRDWQAKAREFRSEGRAVYFCIQTR